MIKKAPMSNILYIKVLKFKVLNILYICNFQYNVLTLQHKIINQISYE